MVLKNDIISILCPTRKRLPKVLRMIASACDLANDPSKVEILLYLDSDDAEQERLIRKYISSRAVVKTVVGERKPHLSDNYHELFKQASGSILLIGADDIVFNTKDWDTLVRKEFAQMPDGMVLLKPIDDSFWGKQLACHPFVPRSLATVLGYLVPPNLSRYIDGWLWHIFTENNRVREVPVEIVHIREYSGEPTLLELNVRLKDDLERYKSRRHECERDTLKVSEYVKTYPKAKVPSDKLML